MKTKILILALFLFQSATLLAQDEASLKIGALKSYKAAVNMDFDGIFDTTYPKLFEIIPKDQMKEMFIQMMENEQFSIKLVETDPNFKFGQIKKIEDKSFCVINHNTVMLMTFKSPVVEVEEMKESFKKIMDANVITFDKTTNSFRLESTSTLIAIADELTEGKWKFLNKDKDNRIFSMVFNDKFQKELGF